MKNWNYIEGAKVGNYTPNYRYKGFLITNPEGYEFVVFLQDGLHVGYRGTTSKAQAEDWCDWHDPKTGKPVAKFRNSKTGNDTPLEYAHRKPKVINDDKTGAEEFFKKLSDDVKEREKKDDADIEKVGNSLIGKTVWVKKSDGHQYKATVLREDGGRVYVNTGDGDQFWRLKHEIEVINKVGNAQWDRAYYKQMIDPAKWNEFEKKFEKLIYDQNLERYDMEDRMSLKPELRSEKYKMIERQRKDVESMINKYRKTGNIKNLDRNTGTIDWDVANFNGQWYVTKNGQKLKGPFMSMKEAERYLDGHKWELQDKYGDKQTGNVQYHKVGKITIKLEANDDEWTVYDASGNELKSGKGGLGRAKTWAEHFARFTNKRTGNSAYDDGAKKGKEDKRKGKQITAAGFEYHAPGYSSLSFKEKEEYKKGYYSTNDLKKEDIYKWGNSAQDDKFAYVMREFDEGKLKTPDGKVVTDPAQAKAIAYSESKKTENGLARARKAMNKGITMWKGNDSAYIKEDGTVSYLENNSFETDKDKFESQESAIKELSKQGYVKK